MRASEKGGCINTVGSISTAEHARRMAKRLGRQPLMTELVKETRTKKSEGFTDERTKKALEDYQALLVEFLTHNPQLKCKGTGAGTKQSKRDAKDPNKPKRPPSAFFVFMYVSMLKIVRSTLFLLISV
ncbi:unnamed protein product [Vicia faba]|uniref:Uncharacterized protein n=1 Tax=Vicia faba TaxID=3906 RepID=A0AAV0Z1K5_VICFA|nr:unnamed protein product [Vicia faba]